MVYPLLVALVSTIFSLQVGRDYAAKRRPYQAFWCASLALSAAASFAYIVAAGGHAAWAFRLYYVFGALLVAPYMGMGSLYLVVPRRACDRLAWVLHAAASLGVVLVFAGSIDSDKLADFAGTSGAGVLVAGAWLVPLIVLNLFGTVAVAGVAIYSAWRTLRDGANARFLAGNVLIAAGFLAVGLAGSTARWWPEWDGMFWATMALGWVIAFWGFRVITSAPQLKRPAPPGVTQTR